MKVLCNVISYDGRETFYVPQLDVLILGVSDMYRVMYQLEQRIQDFEQDDKESSTWSPPTEFKRRTEKYWIHPDAITEVKVILAQQIPILIFGRDNKKEDEKRMKLFGARTHSLFKDSSLFQNCDSESNVSSIISSAYIHECLHKHGGAILIRWYGKQEPITENSTKTKKEFSIFLCRQSCRKQLAYYRHTYYDHNKERGKAFNHFE